MSTAIAKNFQVGNDSTATNNFTIRQPATPDGTVRIANGNTGTTTDLVTINSAGQTTITGNAIINSNTASDALRITQIGAGNALVVEDSANPDATPFVIDASGNVFKGYTASISTPFPLGFQINGTAGDSGMSLTRWVASTANPAIYLAKSRGAAVGTRGIVSSGDNLGDITFTGDDGTNFVPAAAIVAAVDGTPGTNDMPGNLRFNTTADGASATTERMRIDSAGRVGIGVTPAGGVLGERLQVGATTSTTASASLSYYNYNLSATSGAANYHTQYLATTLTSGFAATGTNYGSFSSVVNQATGATNAVVAYSSSYTATGGGALTTLHHFSAGGATLTSGTVANQSGFVVGAGLVGATNNYGFYGNIASGAGRWNFYAAGTADNYFAGRVGFGSTSLGGASGNYRFSGTITGATSSSGLVYQPTVQSDVTATANIFLSQPSTQDAAFTLSDLRHFVAAPGTITGGSRTAPTNQFGFVAASTLTGATNNFGFYGNIASGTGRWNFYADGTADNYFAGPVQLAAGTAAAPSLTAFGDTNTGLFYPAADTVGISTGGTERLRIDSSGNVGIGTSSPSSPLTIYNATATSIELQSDAICIYRAIRASSDTSSPVFQSRKARGTIAAPTAVASGDASLTITALAYGGTNYRGVAQIQGFVDTYTSDTNISGYLSFSTNAGSTAVTERMRLTAAGSLGIGNTNADERLVVTGGISTTAQSSFNRTSGGTFDFYATDNSTRILSWGPVGVTGAISFWSGSGGLGTTEKARIDPNGNLQVQAGAVVVYQPAPASITTTATLTNADIQAQIINTTGTSYTVTMPLGTTLETLAPWVATNLGYDFSIINTASGTITMAANTGVTTLGALTIATGTSAQFRVRRTAANTFVLYRLS